MHRLFVFFILSLLVSGCRSSGTGLDFYSYEEEEQEGLKFAEQINKETKIMHDAVLDRYINDLGQTMISKGVDEPHFTYTFNVVDSSEVNAFAIPGGHLYVNLALIKEAATEAEMVGVIGHEIGHVVNRHGTKKMTDSLLLQMAASGTAQAVGDNGGQYAGLGVLLFGQAGLLYYGRNAELEADHSGVEILYRTGYDVHALADFFKKLLKIEERQGVRAGGLSELLATHPPTADRIAQANAFVATLTPQTNPKENSKAFEAIRKYVAPMTPQKPKTQGSHS